MNTHAKNRLRNEVRAASFAGDEWVRVRRSDVAEVLADHDRLEQLERDETDPGYSPPLFGHATAATT